MLVRDLCAPHAQPFAPRDFDQPRCVVALGIAKHAAGVLPAGLVLAPPSHDLAHPLLGAGRVTAGQGKARVQHDIARSDRARAVPEREVTRPKGTESALAP